MLEIRSLPATEVRAAGGSGDADPLRIEGYASVFNQPAQIPGAGGKPGFREVIKPGAFTRSTTQGADVVCLFNHDPNQVLGRTKSGTLRLRQDSKGLHYTCDLPNTQTARDLHESISRGDISECSFAFKIPDGGQEWSEERDADGVYFVQRTISDVHVKDVSPVTYPAYGGTNVSARMESAEVPAELRSAVDAKNAALAAPPAAASQDTPAVIPPVQESKMKDFEKRGVVDSIADSYSYQDCIDEVGDALTAKFPCPSNGAEGLYAPSCGKYWQIETYEDFVIVCECGTSVKFAIPYSYVGDNIEFGTPVAVEETYVPSERASAALIEFRKDKAKFEKRSVCTECGMDECDCDLDDMLADGWDQNSLKDKDCTKMRARITASTKLDDKSKDVLNGKIQKYESGVRSAGLDRLHKGMGY